MSPGNLIWGVNSVTVSCLIHYDSLLQNATDIITKCDRYYYKIWQQFYYGMRQMLLQNVTTILLRNAAEIYYKFRQVFFYKMQPFYYKMWQLFTNCDDFIIKCDSYYKMRRLLQITTLHNVWKFWTTYKKDFQTKPYILLTIGTWPTPDSKLIQTKFQKMISVNCVFLITYMPFVNVSSCSQV